MWLPDLHNLVASSLRISHLSARRRRSRSRPRPPCFRPTAECLEARTLLTGTLQFSDVVYEVSENGGAVTVTVERTGDTTGTAAIDYYSLGRTASPGVDYNRAFGKLTFGPGVTSQTFTVTILDDKVQEDDESVGLTLTNPTGGAALGRRSNGTLYIRDDDNPGTIQFRVGDYTVTEDGKAATIEVVRTLGVNVPTSIDYGTVGGGTATPGLDFNTVRGTLRFAANQTSATFTVPIVDDKTPEIPETVHLQLSNPTGGARLGLAFTAVLTITDDDFLGTIGFTRDTYSVNEDGGSATITVQRTGDTSGSATVAFSTVSETATQGLDFSFTPGTLTFAPGQTSASFSVRIFDDMLSEGPESLILVLDRPSLGYRRDPPSAVLTIVDNDARVSGRFEFSSDTYSVSESQRNATITVTRTSGTNAPASVNYRTLPAPNTGTATPNADFSAVSGTLTFNAGQISATFTVPILEDLSVEGAETGNLELFGPTDGATVGPRDKATLTIQDNDLAWRGGGPGDPTLVSNPNNFVGGRAPGPQDTVVFDPAVAANQTPVVDQPVTWLGMVLLSGWTGTLTLGANLTLTGASSIAGGLLGAAAGARQLILPPGATLELAGTSTKTFDRVTLNSQGTTTVTGPGPLEFRNGAGLANNGEVVVAAATTIVRGPGATGTILNRGTVHKLANGDLSIPLLVANQNGAWKATGSGDLTFTGGGTFFGGFFDAGAAAARIRFTDATAYFLSGPFSGTGDGRVELAADLLRLGSGGASFNFTPGLLHWIAGRIARSSNQGVSPLTNLNDFTISGPGAKDLDGVQYSNNGTTTVSPLTHGVAALLLQGHNGTEIRNHRLLRIVDAAFAAGTGTPPALTNGPGARMEFTGSNTVGWPVTNNGGAVEVQSGETRFNSPYTQTDGDTGSFAILFFITAQVLGGGVRGTGVNVAQLLIEQLLIQSHLAPGLSPGLLAVNGNYIQRAGGTLQIELGGLTAGTQYDRLAITGEATLGGTLNVSLLGGFRPAVGDSFQILTFGSRTPGSDFAVYTGLDLGGGLVLTPVFGPTDLRLVAQLAPTPTLRVTTFTPTTTGFTAHFGRPLDPTGLNLYDSQSGGLGPAEVTLVGAAAGPVRGSVVVHPGNGSLTFIATGGPLPADTYTVTFRSAANAFKDTTGGLLDGNRDGTAGDNFTTQFTVGASTARVVSVPDFVRGPGQWVDVPASGLTDLPLRLSDGAGVTSVRLTLNWDPRLLTLHGAEVGAGAPAGTRVTFHSALPGTASVEFFSLTPLAAGVREFVKLIATVPRNAPSGAQHVLDLRDVRVNYGALAARDDDGLHVVGYFGDTTGNGSYSSLDATRVRRVAAGQDRGFLAYRLADPVVVADASGNGSLEAPDATPILQEALGLDQAQLPPLPGGEPIIPNGPPARLSLPTTFSGRPGDLVTIPVNLDASGDLEALDLALTYDTTRLELGSEADVRPGSLTADFDLFAVHLDRLNETVRVGLGRSAGPVRGRGAGSVLQITFRIRDTAPLGAAILNLRHDLFPTQTLLNEGGLRLTPAPSNAAGDVLDGLITVLGPGTAPPGDAPVTPPVRTDEEGRSLATVLGTLAGEGGDAPWGEPALPAGGAAVAAPGSAERIAVFFERVGTGPGAEEEAGLGELREARARPARNPADPFLLALESAAGLGEWEPFFGLG
jgi:hypothetical protein